MWIWTRIGRLLTSESASESGGLWVPKALSVGSLCFRFTGTFLFLTGTFLFLAGTFLFLAGAFLFANAARSLGKWVGVWLWGKSLVGGGAHAYSVPQVSLPVSLLDGAKPPGLPTHRPSHATLITTHRWLQLDGKLRHLKPPLCMRQTGLLFSISRS